MKPIFIGLNKQLIMYKYSFYIFEIGEKINIIINKYQSEKRKTTLRIILNSM